MLGPRALTVHELTRQIHPQKVPAPRGTRIERAPDVVPDLAFRFSGHDLGPFRNNPVMPMSQNEYQWQQEQIERLQSQLARLSGQMGSMNSAQGPSYARCSLVAGVVDAAILLGGSRDVPIVWPVPFRSAEYRIELTPLEGVLGKATLAVLDGTQTAAGATIRVTASLAVALGSRFLAHGTR